MNVKLLEEYIKVLEEYGFEPEYKEKSEELPMDYLQFSIGEDEEGRDRLALICLMNPPKGTPFDGKKEFMSSLTQIHVVLPFLIKEGHLGETARMLMFFNQSMETPGFGMDERTKTIYYRFSFPHTTEKIADEAFIGILGMVMFYVDMLYEDIETVASGVPMKEVIKENLELLQKG